MAIANIAMPFLRMEGGSNEPCIQKDAIPEAAGQVWLKDSLVYLVNAGAGVSTLNKCASLAVLCYGQSPDASVGTGPTTPPSKLFGTNHFCFDLRDRIIEINIAAGTTGGAGGVGIGTNVGVTWAGGGTGGVAMAPGQVYALYVPTSGTYKDYQFINVEVAATPMFQIVALAPNQGVNDNNPRVWAKIIPANIQG